MSRKFEKEISRLISKAIRSDHQSGSMRKSLLIAKFLNFGSAVDIQEAEIRNPLSKKKV